MRRIAGVFEHITFAFSGVVTVVMVGLVVLAVVMRYVFNAPLVFSHDLTVVLFAWAIFSSLGLAERHHTHLAVDIIDHVLPARAASVLIRVRQLLVAGFCLWFAYMGFKLLMRSNMDITSLRISIRWLYASFPIGFLLLAVAQVLNIIVPRPANQEVAEN